MVVKSEAWLLCGFFFNCYFPDFVNFFVLNHFFWYGFEVIFPFFWFTFSSVFLCGLGSQNIPEPLVLRGNFCFLLLFYCYLLSS